MVCWTQWKLFHSHFQNGPEMYFHSGDFRYLVEIPEIKKDKASRLHARRQMLKVLYDVTDVPTARAGKKKNTKKVDMPAKLFDELAPKYANRNGGYSRIVKIGQRKGDGAMEVLLELV